MPKLTAMQCRLLAAVLATVLAVTRSHHYATLAVLPDASWAVFFLAGVYLPSAAVLPALLALAGVVDLAAFAWGGVDTFCYTPAYVALLPAYGALWLAGRWYARQHRDALRTLVPLAAATGVGATLCELFASGAFYFYSGRVAAPTLNGFLANETAYFPPCLMAMTFYVALAVLVHGTLVLASPALRDGRRAA